ncbi:MAG: hypothetical protein CL479_02930 [Acidobacteria bacterium]|nr:hypothetical protein [Acidobacteriota bacterium]
MFSMSDRNILVTGAGSGIGKATALMLGQQDAAIIVVDKNQEKAHRTFEELRGIRVRAAA